MTATYAVANNNYNDTAIDTGGTEVLSTEQTAAQGSTNGGAITLTETRLVIGSGFVDVNAAGQDTAADCELQLKQGGTLRSLAPLDAFPETPADETTRVALSGGALIPAGTHEGVITCVKAAAGTAESRNAAFNLSVVGA